MTSNKAFTDIPNLGPALSNLLHLGNVDNIDNLRTLGSQQAFIRINSIDPDACLCKLYALEGAVENIRWHNLSKEKKNELKDFYDHLNSQLSINRNKNNNNAEQ